jgi:hypothetical protein
LNGLNDLNVLNQPGNFLLTRRLSID